MFIQITAVQEFDIALGGGIRRGSLTELVGPAGVGKTQCCFMLTVAALTIPDKPVNIPFPPPVPPGRRVRGLLIDGWTPDHTLGQMHPPLMDTVTVTAMLYRFVMAFGL